MAALNSPGASKRFEVRLRSRPSDGGPSVALPSIARPAATPTTGSSKESSCTPNCLTITLSGNSGRMERGPVSAEGGVSDGSGRRKNCTCPIVSQSTSSRRLNKASRFQISRTLSTLSQGPLRSERTISLIEASEDKAPSTAPIETLVASEDSALESRLARMPLSSSAARAAGQSARSATISATTPLMGTRRRILESLSDADIKRDPPGPGALLERKGEVGPDRPDRRVIAQTNSDGLIERRAEIRKVRGVGVARIEERHDSNRVGHSHPELRRHLEQAAAADHRAKRAVRP